MKKFIDLHVHSIFSSGVDSPSRLLQEAEKLGIQIGIPDIEIHPKDKKTFKEALSSCKVAYIIVHGGSDEINRLAVGDRRVDVLAHPELGRKDSGIDDFIAREARENEVAIEVNLSSIINSWGTARAYALSKIKMNLMLARKYKFDLIAASSAKSRYGLRSAACVFELLKLIGFTDEEAVNAMETTPEKILNKSKRKKNSEVAYVPY